MRAMRALFFSGLLSAFASAQETSDPCRVVTVTHVSQDIPCATVGSLTIGPDLAGDLELVGVREVRKLKMDGNKGLEYLTSKSLTKIESDLFVNNSASLEKFYLPNLTSVVTIHFEATPRLYNIGLDGIGGTNVEFIYIQGTALGWLDLHPASVDYLIIRNNTSLRTFSSNVQSLGVVGDIALDAPRSFLNLSNMIWANDLKITNATKINLQSLISINSSLILGNNTFESFSVPVLETVSSHLIIKNNSKVVELDFPRLEKVGNLTVAANTAIMELDGFPKLAEASHKVVLDGDFKYVEMPSLSNAAGGLWVTSSENISYSCAALEKVFQSERPHQGFQCRGADGTLEGDSTVKGSPEGTTADQEGEDALPAASSTGALSGGAVAGIVIGVLAAVGILAVVIFLVWRRRSKAASAGGNTSMVDTSGLRGAKYAYAHPNAPELQGVPRAELATAAPELAGSTMNGTDTVYHEVDGTAQERRG